MRLAALLLGLAACGPSPPPPADAPVTLDTIRVDDPARQFTAEVAVPVVAASPRASATIRDSVAAVLRSLAPEAPPPGLTVTALPVHVVGTVTSVYVSASVASALLSVDASVEGADASPFLLPITADLATGAPVDPAAAFRPGSAWADTVAAYVARAAARRFRSVAPAGLAAVRSGRVALTLAPDSVVAHVPAGQLAPGPGVRAAVPASALARFLRE